MVYARAKNQDGTTPFGTKRDVYADHYEFATHSMWPVHVKPEHRRVMVGGPACTRPYSASILNISAMSYGALSDNAILVPPPPPRSLLHLPAASLPGAEGWC